MKFRWPWQPPPSYPAFYEAYLAHFAQAYPLNTPIESLRFVVFDTETTGLDPRTDKLLSIGAVVCQANEIPVRESFDLLLPAQKPAATKKGNIADAIIVHGILPGAREGTVPEAEAIPAFLAYCRQAVLVGHHVSFDVAMINRALDQLGAGPLKNPQVDTIHLARRVHPPNDSTPAGHYTLDYLAKQHHIPLSDRHTAPGDAYITALLLLKLLAKLKIRGVKTLKDLLK